MNLRELLLPPPFVVAQWFHGEQSGLYTRTMTREMLEEYMKYRRSALLRALEDR